MRAEIFREYDIRGLVEDELTPEVVGRIGPGLLVFVCAVYRPRAKTADEPVPPRLDQRPPGTWQGDRPRNGLP